MSNYLKAIVAGLASALVIANIVLSRDNPTLTPDDWQNIITAAFGPILVLVVPNLPKWFKPAEAAPPVTPRPAVPIDQV